MPLGKEVDLGAGDILLDRVPSPPKRGPAAQFSAHDCCGKTAGWIKMPLGTEVELGPGHIVLDLASSFRRISTVAKRSPISATAVQLCKHLYRAHV